MTALTNEVLQQLKNAVGPDGYLEGDADTKAYAVDARELYHGKTALVLRPATTEEVSTVVKI
ncbi:MAG: hydroxyacid dehydrogenase, partial [Pseudomonadota bacterium]|nr:hydroxyacid dehydrogenase [Pseudomonadota bacterium]